MAREGRAGVAMGVLTVGSFVIGTFSVIGRVALGPALTKVRSRFGLLEYFSIMLMSLTMVTYLARIPMIKALIMACLGAAFGSAGMAQIHFRHEKYL